MKKGFLMAVLLMMVLGCAGTPLQTSENVALQVVAQRVGYYVGKGNPAIAPQAKLIAQGIAANTDGDLAKAALDTALVALSTQFPDPLLAADIKLIVSSLNLKVPAAKIDVSAIQPLITAFLNGLAIGAGATQ